MQEALPPLLIRWQPPAAPVPQPGRAMPPPAIRPSRHPARHGPCSRKAAPLAMNPVTANLLLVAATQRRIPAQNDSNAPSGLIHQHPHVNIHVSVHAPLAHVASSAAALLPLFPLSGQGGRMIRHVQHEQHLQRALPHWTGGAMPVQRLSRKTPKHAIQRPAP